MVTPAPGARSKSVAPKNKPRVRRKKDSTIKAGKTGVKPALSGVAAAAAASKSDELRRKSNRAAASRCREKKRQKVSDLQQRTVQLKAANNQLKNEVELLKAVISRHKGALDLAAIGNMGHL